MNFLTDLISLSFDHFYTYMQLYFYLTYIYIYIYIYIFHLIQNDYSLRFEVG